jgi:predicted transcriptional regulator of viral defense system
VVSTYADLQVSYSIHCMPLDRRELRRRLTTLAASQSGYFTAAQALALGYSYQQQKYHRDQANWLLIDRGIYRLPEWPAGEHESLVRWSLWARGKAVVSHETALAVHELGDANPVLVHLTVSPEFRARAPGVKLHRAVLPADDVRDQQGFRITTPLRTLLDVASGNLDQDQLTTAVVDALQRGSVTRRQLLARVDAFGNHAALRIERALAIGAQTQ